MFPSASDHKIVRARIVYPVTSPPIGDGAVEVRGGRIVSVRRWKETRRSASGRIVDLGEAVLLPGFVNAHCHLDYMMLKGAISPPSSFTKWIRRINALKSVLGDDDYIGAIALGYRECLKYGTTTVFNTMAFPELLGRVPKPPLRVWWFMEALDIRKASPPFRYRLPAGWDGGVGLSPHSPYTASAGLIRRANRTGYPISMHVAESREEARMFDRAEGPLYDFLKGLGRDMSDCGSDPVVASLVRRGLLREDAILVHVNEVANGEVALLGGRRIVHCPKSHGYFRHAPFRWEELEGAGARIAVGTDSLASNDGLSLLGELRALQKAKPGLGPARLLAAITAVPGAFLAGAPPVGRIESGAPADLVAIPYAGAARDAADAVIAWWRPVPWVMAGGEVRVPGG